MDVVKLKSRLRTGTGRRPSGRIRRSGWIPAIFYGNKFDAQNIEVEQKDFATLVRGKKITHLIDLGLENGGTSVAVIKDIQRNCMNNHEYYHIDFQRVDMKVKITVKVPVELSGIPMGVKETNGVLNFAMKQVTIECLPSDIPEKVIIDVSNLNIGNSIHVQDVKIENITLKEPPHAVIAAVTHATEEAVKVEAVAAPVAAAPTGAPGSAPGSAPKAAPGAAPAKAPAKAGGDKKK